MDMKLLFQSLSILVTLSNTAASPYWFVLAPDAIRFGHKETVLVAVFEAQNQNVTVWLEYNGKKISEPDSVLVSQERPMTVTVEVTEEGILDDVLKTKAKYVTLMARCMNQVKQTELLVNYDSGYLLILLDKPLYSPGQQVNYKVMALDERLKRHDNTQLAIDIINSNNTIVRRTKVNPKDVMYTDFYEIPSYADLNLWTIKAYYMGQYNTEARKTFDVQKYELPTFEVKVKMENNFILPDTDQIVVEVEGRYVYGKPVKGSVGLKFYLRNDNISFKEMVESMDRRYLDAGTHVFNVDTERVFNAVEQILQVQFPSDDYYLHAVADVVESVTGNEEMGDTKVVFAKTPYIIKFTRSRDNFRPGYVYSLLVDFHYANGRLLNDELATLKMTNMATGNVTEQVKPVTNGRIAASFPTDSKDANNQLTFQVTVRNYTTEAFIIRPYQGDEQVKIEMVIDNGHSKLRIFGNAKGFNRYTGILVVVLVRGSIMRNAIKYYDMRYEIDWFLEEKLLKQLSPSGRALVFYVHKASHTVVSDAVHFEVTPRCQGEGLKLQTKKAEYTPGKTGDLIMTGEPEAQVHLLAIDKALLLLNSNNVLKPDTMFNLLDGHDGGCGAGGGISNRDVFKRSGVAALTNANLVTDRRNTLTCDKHLRKKRSIPCLSSVPAVCCTGGIEYATKIVKDKRELGKTRKKGLLEGLDLGDDLDLMSKCYTAVMELARRNKQQAACLNQWLKFCLNTVAIQEDEDNRGARGKTLGDESDYERTLNEWLHGDDIKIRANFKESFLFTDKVQLDKDGRSEQLLPIPSSITTWQIQGLGYSEEKGVCIAEPIEVQAFKDFFIQLELPYSAVRLEEILIKATVFNYYKGNLQVRAFIKGVDGLCSGASVGHRSPMQERTLPGNSAHTFTFMVLPLRAGLFDITIDAIGKIEHDGVNHADAVQKTLKVVNEGKMMHRTIKVCLDPDNHMQDCEDDADIVKNVSRIEGTETMSLVLKVPEDAVPQSGYAMAYIKSNIMDDVVQKTLRGTEALVRKPSGCGEQTMSKLAPCVYAMLYLKQTDQLSDELEKNGYDYIRQGMEKMPGFRQPNNAYGFWSYSRSSTWISAYVMKMFCQAKKVVDNAVSMRTDVFPTFDYIMTQQNANGMFEETKPVINRGHDDPSLTAFVVISFMECDGRTPNMNATVLKAVKYLENLPKAEYQNNDYLLAITTYALSLAKSPKKWEFMRWLKSAAKTDGAKMYWGSPRNSNGYANAQTIETTSYALLAFLNFQYDGEASRIVRWLLQERDGYGAFRTTVDTVIGLQALAEYNSRTYTIDVDLDVEFQNNKGDMRYKLTNENSQVFRVVEGLQIGNEPSEVRVKVSGVGSAYLDIVQSYNVLENKPCPFKFSDIETKAVKDVEEVIDPNIAKERGCDVCGYCSKDVQENERDYDDEMQYPIVGDMSPAIDDKSLDRRRRDAEQNPKPTLHCISFDISSENETNMAIAQVYLQTSVSVIKDDLDKLLNDEPMIDRYEMPESSDGYITFYLDKLGPKPVKIIFRVSDNAGYETNTRQMAKVDVYDYYKPDHSCTKFYGIDAKDGKPLQYQCDAKQNRNCVCLQNVCASNPARKWRHLLKNKRIKPAIYLKKRICTTDKADYAVLVKLEDPKPVNLTTQYISVTGVIQKVLHEGKEHLKKGAKMTFRYKVFCEDSGRAGVYYVIGKNGAKKANGLYELMEPSIILKRPNGGQLKTVMKAFERMMAKGCDV